MSKALSVPVFAVPSLAAVFAATALTGCGSKAPPPIAPVSAQAGPVAPAADASGAATAPEPFSLKAGEQLVPHKVQKGDSLWELAQTYQTRVSRIKSANNMESDMIIEGRTIQIPTAMSGAPAPAAGMTPAAAAPPAPATATPAPALAPPPSLTPPPAVPAAPAPAPAPASPPPSLNFGTPPAAPATGGTSTGIQFRDN